MVPIILENGNRTKLMDKDLIFLRKEHNTQASGIITNSMAKE